jgi:hypothetical protein
MTSTLLNFNKVSDKVVSHVSCQTPSDNFVWQLSAVSQCLIQPYLMKQNEWTEHTMNDIHWDSHGSSHSHYRPQWCFLVKLCHRHLPLGQTLHRHDSKYPSICPGCRTASESQDHFIQCSVPPQITWRIALLSNLQTQMSQMKMDMSLQETLLDCIDRSPSNRDQTMVDTFRPAMKAQQWIGWLGLFWDYWTKEWQHAYENTYSIQTEETHKQRNKHMCDMEPLQKKVLQTLLSSMITLWTTRYKERHGRDKDTRDSARRKVLHSKLKVSTKEKTNIPPEYKDSSAIHTKSISMKRWIKLLTGWMHIRELSLSPGLPTNDSTTLRSCLGAAMEGQAIRNGRAADSLSRN